MRSNHQQGSKSIAISFLDGNRHGAAGDAPPLAVANYGAALPTDVLHDILLRLPADEVRRLRLVCRSWRSATSDPVFAAAHATRHPQLVVVVVVVSDRDRDEVEVRAVDPHGGGVIKQSRIRIPEARRELGRLSLHGDLLCLSHGWGKVLAVDTVTGAVVADVADEHPRRMNGWTPQCVLGHVPSTGEYKVVRLQEAFGGGDDYSSSRRRRRRCPSQTTCEVLTLGGGVAGGIRWRRRRPPPVNLNIVETSWSCGCSGRNVAVVAGLAYFLVDQDDPGVRADGVAVLDLAAEEWKPAPLTGPLSSRGKRIRRRCTDDDPALPRKKLFQLAVLGGSLVMLCCDVEGCSTELWFMEQVRRGSGTAPRWSRRYTLRRALRYHYPLAVLDDGKLLVWADSRPSLPSALRAYDPGTGAWTDLATPTATGRGCVVGVQRGSLLCSN